MFDSTINNKPPGFACDLTALTPAQRKRQAEVLSPALESARLGKEELADGYALTLASGQDTHSILLEWVSNERLCCPFVVFDVRVGSTSEELVLRITGPEGVKPFIRSELAHLLE